MKTLKEELAKLYDIDESQIELIDDDIVKKRKDKPIVSNKLRFGKSERRYKELNPNIHENGRIVIINTPKDDSYEKV